MPSGCLSGAKETGRGPNEQPSYTPAHLGELRLERLCDIFLCAPGGRIECGLFHAVCPQERTIEQTATYARLSQDVFASLPPFWK
jgi:hypothetical protein